MIFFFCVGVMYSGEYDARDVTLSVNPHRASLKNMPDHGGNRTYDLWNTSPISYTVQPQIFKRILPFNHNLLLIFNFA